jgi:hypothetical protein
MDYRFFYALFDTQSVRTACAGADDSAGENVNAAANRKVAVFMMISIGAWRGRWLCDAGKPRQHVSRSFVVNKI